MNRVIAVALFALLILANAMHAEMTLQQIKDNLASKSVMSADTMGSAYAPIKTALNLDSVTFTNFSGCISNDPPTLEVSGIAVAGSVTAPFHLYVQKAEGFTVGVSLTVQAANWVALYEQMLHKLPAELAGITGKAALTFQFANKEVKGFAPGLAISGDVEVHNDKYLKPFKDLNPGAQDFDFSLSLTVPIYTKPGAIVFSLTEKGMLHVTKSISIGNAALHVNMEAKTYALGGAMSVLVDAKDSLLFDLAATYALDSDSFSLSGDLKSSVAGILGLDWLTLTGASAALKIDKAKFTSLSLDSTYAVKDVTDPVKGAFNVTGDANIYAALTNIPISNVQSFVTSLYGKEEAILKGVTAKGVGSIEIANYAGASSAQGVTLTADVTVETSSNIHKAAKSLSANATNAYQMKVYFPAFGAATPAEVSFSENGPFVVAKGLTGTSYIVDAKFGAAASISLSAELSAVVGKPPAPVAFTASGSWAEGAGLTMKGKLSSDWVHPMNAEWLTLTTGSEVSVVIGGDAPFTFSMSGGAKLTFIADATPTFELSVGGADLSNVLISVSGVPLKTLTTAYEKITKKTSPAGLSDVSVTGTVGVSLCTYQGASAPEGVALTAEVQVASGSKLAKALELMVSGSRSYNFKLVVDMFAETPSINVDISEKGEIKVNDGLTVKSYGVSLDIGSTFSVNIHSELSFLFAKNPAPVVFDVSGGFSGGSGATLSGNLVGDWDKPFGHKYLDVTSLAASLSVGGGSLFKGTFNGGVSVVSEGKSANGTLSVVLSDNFQDLAFIATVKNVFTLEMLLREMTGKPVSDKLKGLALTTDIELDLAICTTATDHYKSGITIETKGDITGDLYEDMKKHLYFVKHLESAQFDISLNVPVFSSNPLAIALEVDVAKYVQLSPNTALTEVNFGLAVSPFQAHLETIFQANFSKQEPLTFDVEGAFKSGLEVDLSGTMLGTWKNAFGLKGFDLSNVAAEIGFSPHSPIGLSDVGLGATMDFGKAIITLDGNVAFPHVEDIFLKGEYKKTAAQPSVRDVAAEWNAQNPDMPVATGGLPDVYLQEALFQLATAEGSFAGVHYQPGLAIHLVLDVVGMNLNTSINCTEAGGSLTPDCKFAFHVSIAKHQLEQLIRKELEHLGKIDPSLSDAEKFQLFHLNGARIGQWSQFNQAKGIPATFTLDYVFFNKQHVHTVDIKHQDSFFTDFRSFFGTFLKALF